MSSFITPHIAKMPAVLTTSLGTCALPGNFFAEDPPSRGEKLSPYPTEPVQTLHIASAPPIQKKTDDQPKVEELSTPQIHQWAAKGVQGSGVALPYCDEIQQAFGHHNIGHVRAYLGTNAATASHQIGAKAYATGNKIAFAETNPSLHTVAHEATHIVQQQAGVHLQEGIGEAKDNYERQADRVADRVVQGHSVEILLGSNTTNHQNTVQTHQASVQKKSLSRKRPLEEKEEKSLNKKQKIIVEESEGKSAMEIDDQTPEQKLRNLSRKRRLEEDGEGSLNNKKQKTIAEEIKGELLEKIGDPSQQYPETITEIFFKIPLPEDYKLREQYYSTYFDFLQEAINPLAPEE